VSGAIRSVSSAFPTAPAPVATPNLPSMGRGVRRSRALTYLGQHSCVRGSAVLAELVFVFRLPVLLHSAFRLRHFAAVSTRDS
jgi:hypothetical protein